MNKQYAYGPWKPVKDFVQTDRNIQLKTDGHQTTNPSGYPVDAFELDELDEISTLYREVHEFDSSWTLNTSGERPNVPDAELENFEVYFANGTVSRKISLVLLHWEPALNYTILAWRRAAQDQPKLEFVCNENTIVTGILSKEGAKALLKLHEDCQKQCQLLGVPYEAGHLVIEEGKEFSYTLGNYLEFQKLGVELFVDNRVKVQA